MKFRAKMLDFIVIMSQAFKMPLPVQILLEVRDEVKIICLSGRQQCKCTTPIDDDFWMQQRAVLEG